METIIKYDRPKDTKRGGNNTVLASNIIGGDNYTATQITDFENYLLWKESVGVHSLIPQNSQNVASGESSVAIGTHTRTVNEGEMAIGTFNQPHKNETLFTIGNGESDTNRSNLIQIGNNSTVINNHLSGITASFSEGLDTSAITAVNIEALSGTIETLLSENITVDNLTVTKAAHFFKLIIDEVKATQGQLIITPSNAVIDKVTTVNGNWRCYFRSTDADGREISNTFEPNDQIVCQTFNAATGTTYDANNRYYWNLCVRTGSTSVLIDGTSTKCHYIDLSKTDKDSSSISTPQVGDSVVMLGNRTDTSRQSAIIISAYESQFLDATIKAPSIAQYYGINDYNLASHRHNVLSREFNRFKGDFTTTAGDDIGSALSTLTVNVNGINTRVTNIEGDYVNSTQLTQTADTIRSEVQQQIDNIKFEKVVRVDARNLDQSKVYPVTISFNQSNQSETIRCAVSRTLLEEFGVPNYSTHSRGFVLDLDWTTRASGWGTNDVQRYWSTNDKTRFISEFELMYTDNTDLIVGSIGQVLESSTEIVYIRGGSAYDILTSFKDATITLHPTGYTFENQQYSVLDNRPVMNYTDIVLPIKDRMGRSEIIQTADNIQLNVYDELKTKTGIDVASGMIRLQADKTIFENNSNTSAMWLRGQINGQTKWALIANERYPIMRFGNNADSSVNCTYITPDAIHIQPTTEVSEYMTFQIANQTPSIFLKRGNTRLQLYIDSNGKVRFSAESFPYVSNPWPTINEVNSGEVYADNNGYLRVKN